MGSPIEASIFPWYNCRNIVPTIPKESAMKKDAEIKVRVPAELKREAFDLYGSLGLSVSTAIELFLRASVREGGLPFDLKVKPAAERGANLAGTIDGEGNTFWPAEEDFEGDDVYDGLWPRN